MRPASPAIITGFGKLPIAGEAVTAIGFHSAGAGAMELSPVGRQANEGLLARLWRRIAGSAQAGPVWYQLEGGPGTEVLDVGAAPALVVSLSHLEPDPSLAVGSPVLASSSKLGSVVDVAAVERQALAKHARARGNNVAIDVHPAAGSLP